MRVIAGTARGRRFETLPGLATRPTLDRVKESVFGSLQFDLPGSSVLDLFSGSGSLAFEALSRGAAFAVCNDVSPACTALIRRNAAALHLDERLTVLQLDYRAAIERIAGMGVRFDFAFLDAPYESGFGADAAERLFRQRLMQPDGRILIEHAAVGEIAAVSGRDATGPDAAIREMCGNGNGARRLNGEDRRLSRQLRSADGWPYGCIAQCVGAF